MIKNSKIGLFTDIHIGLSQDSQLWHNTVLDFAKWSSQKFLEKGINDIIICGDIFHNRSEISVATLDTAKKFFDYFKDFQLYILAGNHDSFFKNHSKVNSISLLDGWSNIKIIDNDVTEIKIKDKKAVLVPWGTNYENIPVADIIFGHFEIVSFYMNTYKVCEHGMSSNDLFKKAKTIVSGHFHKKDHRKYDNGEIVYLGSPYQQNFGDTLDERGIYIYDIENNDFEFIENDISPKYYKLSVDKLLKNEQILENLNIKNNHISLTVDSNIDSEQVLLLSSNVQKHLPINFRIEYAEPDLKINKEKVENELNFVNIIDDIETYVDSIDIKNKKEVKEYIKQIYNLKTND
jgi:DNA repair exonuclease SbcCD nuclease subunit